MNDMFKVDAFIETSERRRDQSYAETNLAKKKDLMEEAYALQQFAMDELKKIILSCS